MKKIYAILSLLVAAATSCTTEVEEFFTGSGEVSVINVSAEEFHNSTRTTISNMDYSVKWREGDVIGIFPMEDESNQIAFKIKSGSGSSDATFDGKGWGLKSGTSYAAYYPYFDSGLMDKTEIPLNYAGQVQNGNNSTSHLGVFDFMYAEESSPANGALTFMFQHVGTLVHFQIPVVASRKYTKVTIATDGAFYTQATLNLTTKTVSPVEKSKTTSIELPLTNTMTESSENQLSIYLMMLPVDLNGHQITVKAYDDDGTAYQAIWDGKNLTPSKCHNLTADDINAEGEIPYVTFSAESAQSITMAKAVETLQYSVNGAEWQDLGTTTVNFGGSAGDLRLRGKSSFGTAKTTSDYTSIVFGTTAPVDCYGDIRTLIDWENHEDVKTQSARFINLFYGCDVLKTAPELPALALANYCYYQMFYGCTSLESAPELPAKSANYYCYQSMFQGCSSLVSAPSLPAMSLSGSCYKSMFQDCTSLTSAPALPATTLADDCYGQMFKGCKSLASASTLPAKIMIRSCYQSMFQGCTSLTSAPELPATTLDSYCYSQMFFGCLALTSAPALPATTLAHSCYKYMFQGCTSLTSAPALPASTLAPACYDSMFYGCSKLTSAPALPATTLTKECYASMFLGCKSLTSTPALPATTLASSCYTYMFEGCTSLTSTPASLPATTLFSNCYFSMFEGCTSLTSAPELPATTLEDNCYSYMFSGCRKLSYIKMMATDINPSDCLFSWTYDVSSTGTFVKNAAATWNNSYAVPSGWTVQTATE